MKRMILITAVILTAMYTCLAQCDDKFYYPSQEWQSMENMDYNETYFHIDKDTLHTILFKTKATPKATIIFFHGTGGNISYNASFGQSLSLEGYQVVMIDFRGYGKSTGKPTHLNIAHDAQFIFDKLIVSDALKGLPVIVYGASIGTQVATKITKDNKDKIDALIIEGAMSSFTHMALLSAPEEQKEMIANYVTSPYSAVEDIKHTGSMPKLFIHGMGDTSIPFSQGEAVYSNAPEPKTFWKYDGNHLEAASKFHDEFMSKIDALFADIH